MAKAMSLCCRTIKASSPNGERFIVRVLILHLLAKDHVN